MQLCKSVQCIRFVCTLKITRMYYVRMQLRKSVAHSSCELVSNGNGYIKCPLPIGCL